MKLYVHPVTFWTLDFGEPLCVEDGHAFSLTGDPSLAFGFSLSATAATARARVAGANASGAIELLDGDPITRLHDMNPRGDI